ncbi:MAG: HAMP domain-containing protein [Anaerolineae bacterium]|nr:MAG: HAMP domain-containing protein [Anaerolineae bacterium]
MIIGPGARVSQEMFLNSVNRSLWSAVLAAGIVAVVLSLTISQRILGPVGELTKAAHRMQSGDLRQRVHVQSQDELGRWRRPSTRWPTAWPKPKTCAAT